MHKLSIILVWSTRTAQIPLHSLVIGAWELPRSFPSHSLSWLKNALKQERALSLLPNSPFHLAHYGLLYRLFLTFNKLSHLLSHIYMSCLDASRHNLEIFWSETIWPNTEACPWKGWMWFSKDFGYFPWEWPVMKEQAVPWTLCLPGKPLGMCSCYHGAICHAFRESWPRW
jgi:hypothetical protein